MRATQILTAIHKKSDIADLIEKRGYLPIVLSPYSSFLNPIKFFRSKIKSGVRREILTLNDYLCTKTIEYAKTVTIQDYVNWIKHSVYFSNKYLALEPNLQFLL